MGVTLRIRCTSPSSSPPSPPPSSISSRRRRHRPSDTLAPSLLLVLLLLLLFLLALLLLLFLLLFLLLELLSRGVMYDHVWNVNGFEMIGYFHVLEFADFLDEFPEGPGDEGNVDEEDADLFCVRRIYVTKLD